MSSDDVEDVRRVLAICFRNGEPLHALDLERILSFDMEWITPDEAEGAVQELVAKGWLSGDENALKPTVALEGVRSPLGWFPRPSRCFNLWQQFKTLILTQSQSQQKHKQKSNQR